MGLGSSKKKKDKAPSTKPLAEYDYLFKVLLVGVAGVGKTSILQRYDKDEFIESNVKGQSLGVDFIVKTIDINGLKVKLQKTDLFVLVKQASSLRFTISWSCSQDTAGQERFRTITSSYFRGAHIALIVYDITSMESFDRIQAELQTLERYACENITKGVIGNKTDLASDRIVSTEKAQDLCDQLSLPLWEVSAKSGENIEAPFVELARIMKEKVEE